MIYEARCPKCRRLHVYRRKMEQRNDTPECCGMKTLRIISPTYGYVNGPAAG